MYLLCAVYILCCCYAAIKIISKNGKIEIFPFNKERTNNLKGILAFLIVVVHLNTMCFRPSGFSYPIISQMAGAWGQWCVVLFFMMSGYGLVFSVSKNRDAYLAGFVQKRFSKIVVPFIAVETLVNSLLMICGQPNIFGGGKLDICGSSIQ